MPDQKKAEEMSIRFQASLVDGTWKMMKKRLGLDFPLNLTFNDLSKRYLEDYVSAYNRDIRNKVSRLKILSSRLGNVPLESLSRSHASKIITWRKAQGSSNKTINRYLALMRHMLSWAVDEGLLETNPIQGMRGLREVEWEGQRPAEEVVDAVFSELDPRVDPLFTFLRETGCRREEGLSFKHHPVDHGRAEAVFWSNTKNGKSRRVPLTEEALDAIRRMPKASEYVFYHPSSLTRWYDCRKPWEDARERAGHPWLRVHDLRHAYGIRLAEQGCPMHFISEVMGHRSVDFTRKMYARFSPESASRAVLRVLEGGKKGTNRAQKII